jgi:TatD DNase family protein
MLQLTDTHTHLYVKEFDTDRDAMIERAIAGGVHKMYMPAIDRETHDALLAVADQYPQHCIPMMGVHPCSIKENYLEELAIAERYLGQRTYAAVGEIGLDYYWDKEHIPQQKEAFRTQCGWAKQLNIPIVIHSRDSTQDCIDIVREQQDGTLKGVFHCFTGSVESAREIIKLGLYLGIGGVLTYKNAKLYEVLEQLDMDRIVLETDAPYLTPVPHRGKRNESAYVQLIAQRLAEIKGISIEEVAAITTANAEKLFGQ